MHRLSLNEILTKYVRRFVLLPSFLLLALLLAFSVSFFSWREQESEDAAFKAFGPLFAAQLLAMDSVGLERQLGGFCEITGLREVQLFTKEGTFIGSYPAFNQRARVPQLAGCSDVRKFTSVSGEIVGSMCIHRTRWHLVSVALVALVGSYCVFFWFLKKGFAKATRLVGELISEVRDQIETMTNGAARRISKDFPAGASTQEAYELAMLASRFSEVLRMEERAAAETREAEFVKRLVLRVAHDIRSPVAVLNSLRGSLDSKSDIRGLLDGAVMRLQTIASDILDSHRIEERGDFFIRNDGLGKLLEQLLEAKRIEFPNTQFEMVVTGAFEPTKVSFKKGEGALVRLFSNLINNAAEAMISPGKVIVSIRTAGPFLVVSILDHGPGFSVESLQSFEKSGKIGSTKKDGNGLGLEAAREALEQSEGALEISTRSEGGGRVDVLLKIAYRAGA